MQEKGWKKISEKEIYRNPFVHVTENVYHDELGREKLYGIVHLSDAASVLPIDPHGTVYLGKQYRPAYDGYSIEVPGGKIDPGETPEQTAKRELFEELGIKVDMLISLGSTKNLLDIAANTEYFFLAKLDAVPQRRGQMKKWWSW